MRLYIDTSQREKITISLDKETFITDSKKDKSQKLLSFIDEVLKKKKLTIKNVTEIEVNTGPGSFTGLRVGVTVAQTLGWALKIPVNGKDLKQGQSIDVNYKYEQ